ncbi:MAG: hypothetical protein IJT27_04905 [Clostridia bacterium]|nr:hypothetical protein [Clostridia bacterium]
MKRRRKKKNTPTPQQTDLFDVESLFGDADPDAARRSFVLDRRQKDREKEKRSAEQEQLRVFMRKIKQASGKKAPKTLRTRAYYRFSSVYPGNTDANGFRENAPDPKRRRRQILLGALAAVLAFCAAFIGAGAMRLISAQPPEDAQPAVQPAAYVPQTRILRFSREELARGDTDAMLQTLRENDCNAALFEIKDVSGGISVYTGNAMLAGTDRIVVGAQETFQALKEEGVTLCGYISCFRDTAAAAAKPDMAVLKGSAVGGVWTDNADAGWLNPFSREANAYLLSVVDAAVQAGVDVLVLDNVAFSTDAGSAQAYYPGEGETNATRNSVLVSFVNSVVKNAGSVKTVLMAQYTAFDADALSDAAGYGGNLLSTGAGALCVDARVSLQKKNISVGDETFYDASGLPLPFALAAGEFAQAGMAQSGADAKFFVCTEKNTAATDPAQAAVLLRADGYIIW